MSNPRPPHQEQPADGTRDSDHQPRADDLKQRYLQASAEQALQPSERVRQAALAHAHMVAASRGLVSVSASESISESTSESASPSASASASASSSSSSSAFAAKQSANRWNFSLVASVAIAGISALLAFQFDRSDNQDQQVVLGSSSGLSSGSPLPAPSPSPSPSPALSPSFSAPAAQTSAESSAASPTSLLPPAQLTTGPSEPPASTDYQRSAKPAGQVPAGPASTQTGKPSASPAAPPDTANKARPAAKDQSADALARPAPPAEMSASTPTEKNESETATQGLSNRPTAQITPGNPSTHAQSKTSQLADAESSATPLAGPSTALPRNAASAGLQSRLNVAAAPAAPTASGVEPGAALRGAARSGQITLLDQALQQASMAQINARDDKGRTALMLATIGGHVGSVQRLLSAGADPTLADFDGKTAALMAQQQGNAVIGNLLNKSPVAQ